MSITKSDLSRAIAAETRLSQRQSARAASTLIGLMINALASGSAVRISGFGKFQVKTLPARSGRHPRSGRKIAIPRRRSVGFKCFKGLKTLINSTATASAPPLAPPKIQIERRREARKDNLSLGRACVRISGIPVCDFPIKDLSGNGSCILVEKQSVIMRNISIGQEIEIHLPSPDRNHASVLQRSRIIHITPQGEQDQYPGYVLVGVQVIDRLPSRLQR